MEIGGIAASEWFFLLIFPVVVVAGLLFLIRNYIKAVEYYDSDVRLEGKTVVITGGSSGLGKTLSVELARRGARVVVGCRTKARRDSTAFFLRAKTGSFNIRTLYLDMTRLDSVWDFAKELATSEERIDVLVNNAAIYCPQEYTSDGLDIMMGVNYAGHFLLVNLLADKMTVPSGDLPRIINVVCGSYRGGKASQIITDLETKTGGRYDMDQVYRNSKLALLLFTKELDKRFHDRGIMPYAVDPGLVDTGLRRHLPGSMGEMWRTMAKALYRTPEEGIQGLLHVICTRCLEKEAGKLFQDGHVVPATHPEWTAQVMQDIWDSTLEIIKGKEIRMTLDEPEDEEEEGEAPGAGSQEE